MNPLGWMRHLSTRAHLALGLAGLAVMAVLAASALGLVADREQLAREHRGSLAETVALMASGMLDEEQPELLQATLDVVRRRNPGLESIGVRASDGALLLSVGEHDALWTGGTHLSSDAEVMVPVWRDEGDEWGRVELRFQPLRAAGWRAHLQDPALMLSGFIFLVCGLAFWLYLWRMLRELDPSRAVPDRVRDAYDGILAGVLVLDSAGRVVLANQAACKVLGDDEPRLIGRSPSDYRWRGVDDTDIAAANHPWQQALTDKRSVDRRVELRVTSRDEGATEYSLQASCRALTGPRGQVVAVLVCLEDITDLNEARAAMLRLKNEAQAANQAKSQFLANMSHEIRTPMNAILGFTDVLRRSPLRHSSDAAQHLGIIHSSGQHLLNLINDILDLSKVESGRLEAERIAYAPHQVAREVLDTLAERAQARCLSLALRFPQALPAQIDGDPARLRQVLTNLVGNAIKFTEQGSVTVTLRLADEDAATPYCIDVTDTGIGIPADKLDTVFDPFVQAEASTTRRFGGTGLGLTISRGFARAMGGDITVQSTHGEGTTFTVHLPAGPLQGAAMLAPDLLEAAALAPAAVRARRWQFPPARVLVVDDGEHNRHLVRLLLEEVGLQVGEADNGQAALDAIAAGPFDLVLMDMQMPVMDGQTATRALRARGCTLPIVALTANVMKGFERELEEAGFSGHQAKPIDRDALIADLAGRLGGQALADDAAAEAPVASAPAEMPAAPTAAPGADVEADAAPIVSRLASNARFAPIVAGFITEFGKRLARMDRAHADADHHELAQLAHWLKGSGGSMGFDALYEPSLALEQAAKAGASGDAATILAELHRLARRIEAGAAAPHRELTEAHA